MALARLDLVADPARLLLAVPKPAQHDPLALVEHRPQRLAETALILGDERRSGGEDVRRRAVVLLEADDLRPGEIALEAQDVADLGAAPGVDRLIVVADAAEIAMPLRQQPQPQILRDIGVLVLVDQDVAEAMLIVREDVGAGGENGEVVQQQIAEIGGVQRHQPLLIEPEERRGAAVGHLSAVIGRHLVRRQAAVLPALEGGEQRARRPALLVDALGERDLLHQAQLVVSVEDGEIGLETHHLGMPTQEAGGDRMEGAEPEPLGALADHALELLAHLRRGLVGEGHRQELARPGAAQREDVRQPRRQHPRLARAGAGQHQHRPIDRLDRPALRVIEAGEIGR